MLARRSSQILAFTRRDAVRLLIAAAGLVGGMTVILSVEDLATLRLGVDPQQLAGWFLLSLIVVGLLLAWVWRFRPRFWHRNNAIGLLALTLFLATLALRLAADRPLMPYLVPTATVALLLAVLLDAGVSVTVTALLAVVATAASGSAELGTYTFLGGLAGIIVIQRGERLSLFARAAAAMALVGACVVLAYAVRAGDDLPTVFQLLGASLAAALGSAVAAAGTFTLLGNLFGITTSYQLLELANPTQPLLRRLLLEAPGTYHHSLMVGNLAEQAAEAIGADALVVRVAAYYHDVGKLADPQAYIENQAGEENVHDELTPEESAAVLASHVARGIDIAYEYKLPKAIIPFIPQHHGTARMSFFYGKARDRAIEEAGARPGTAAAEEAASGVDERRFRHAGPKPQTKEAAILMLADGVEASVRSLTSHDEPAIRAMVARIIDERLQDGQLDDCDLTLRDLDRIRTAFVTQLKGMYHRRIAYPQNKVVEIESRRAAGGRSGA
jgi:cyclic-di-AMP phosphodiesterase PgpH